MVTGFPGGRKCHYLGIAEGAPPTGPAVRGWGRDPCRDDPRLAYELGVDQHHLVHGGQAGDCALPGVWGA